ncbi:unnamed protein product [Closterium sp. NIES-65]|nr:unnamed protein product [Closterium sp. NIES-65]
MVGARRARFRGGAGETGIGRSSERGGGEERRWIRAERCDGVAGKVGKGGEDGEDGERWGGWEGWGGWGGSGRWGGWEMYAALTPFPSTRSPCVWILDLSLCHSPSKSSQYAISWYIQNNALTFGPVSASPSPFTPPSPPHPPAFLRHFPLPLTPPCFPPSLPPSPHFPPNKCQLCLHLLSPFHLPPRHLLSDPGQKKKKGVTTAEDVEFFLRRRFPSCKLEYIGGQPGQAKEKGEGIVWPVFVFDPFVNDTAFASMLQPIKGLSPRRSPQFRPFALGPRDGVALFHPIPTSSSSSSSPSFSASSAAADTSSLSQETREAAVLRLRTFMCMHSHRWIDILRLDIAGLELDLCENAATAAAAGGGGGGLGGGDAFSTSVGDLTQHGAAALAEKTPVGPTPGSVPIGQVAVRFHAELAGRDGAKRRQKCEETFAAWGLKKVHVMGDGSTVLFARTDAAAAL